MCQHLDAASHRSADPVAGPLLQVVSRSKTGRRGRPRVEISPGFLEQALTLRGPSHIAPVLRCSARTVRRRALEHNLREAGMPVFTSTTLPDGTVARVHHPYRGQPPNLSDDALDEQISRILQVFPRFGRNMINGRLLAAGHNVPIHRIRASYLRVHGAPAIFGGRSIHRKVYSVPGANSLWHHDGQHGKSLCSDLFNALKPR